MILLEKLKDDIEIVSADKNRVDSFIKSHYLGVYPSSMKKIYLVILKGKAVGMAIYGIPIPSATKFLERFASNNEVLELKRLYFDDGIDARNIESHVIGRTLKLLKTEMPEIKFVITFADENAGHVGGIYQATNMSYVGKINGKHKYVYSLKGEQIPFSNPYPKKSN